MILLLIFSIIIGALLTGLIRRYAIRKSLMDIPNERSSHETPVPRGGGWAIVLICLFSIFIMGFASLIERSQFVALVGGGSLVAVIGWLDDHRDVSALLRVVVHFIAAIWTVFWLGGLDPVDLGFSTIDLGWLGSMLAILGMVWLINLYNFMDGTDGIAAVQAITAGSFVIFLFLTGGSTGLAVITLTMVGGTVGFLFWNWSPAKIFMGDAGSSFLGYFFGVLAILGEKSGSVPLLIWLILLSLFFWDATLTLIRRFRDGERWYAAHRSHAYQRFVQMGHSHEKLAIQFLLVNLIFLWPMAWVALKYKSYIWLLVLIVSFISGLLWHTIQKKFDKERE